MIIFCSLPRREYFYLSYPLPRRRSVSWDMSNIVSMVKINGWHVYQFARACDFSFVKTRAQHVLKKHLFDVGVGSLLAVIALSVILPKTVHVDETLLASQPNETTVGIMVDAMQNETRGFGSLPEADLGTPTRTMRIPITAYASLPEQTDSTPCITANGFNVCEHGIEDTIAANFLKYGTRVKMPEVFGDRVFVVRDRMNKRYQDRIDIWMKNKADAKQFGVKILKIEVLVPH